MARVVVIGGTGRIGTYLIPRLVEAGYKVAVVSRKERVPFQPDKDFGRAAWEQVARVEIDRSKAEIAGNFGTLIADLRPDAVIDLICYRQESAEQLVDALRGRVQLLLHCGTIWSSGSNAHGPSRESEPRRPISEYGRRKAAIEGYLLDEARQTGFPAVVLRPGHLVGQGWTPVNPAANLNPKIYVDLAQGGDLRLPNSGLETLHHVHADDLAQAFMCVLVNWHGAEGENFNVTSASALTLREYAEAAAHWFGRSAHLHFLPWEDWKETVSQEDAAITWDHIVHSSNCSIEKAQRILGYQPRYSSLDALKESVIWLIRNGRIEI